MANVLTELNKHIFTITLNRPDKLNALNQETLSQLKQAAEEAAQNDDVRVIIITGSGEKAFVAGADINELAKTNAITGMQFAQYGQQVFNAIENCGKPVIAAVNGFALGGGCELAMACHLRIASDNARFGQPEIKLGVIPGFGGTQRLTRLVGKGKAMEMNLLGDMVSADKAEQMGLVNLVVPQGELMKTVHKVAEQLVNSAPIALRMIIDSINRGLECGMSEALDYEVKAFGVCCSSDDKNEGTAAFLEKRQAKFTGQ